MLVELVGLPGTGKTTICRHLAADSSGYTLLRPPHVKCVSDAPFFIKNLVDVTLTSHGQMLRPFLGKRGLLRALILNGWHTELIRENPKFVGVLDQGPVFTLLQLESACRLASVELPRDWVDSVYDSWRRTLDLIVHLDAPDPVLYERVQRRDKKHDLKALDYPTAVQYLAAKRTLFSHVIDRFRNGLEPSRVIHLATSDLTLTEAIRSIQGSVQRCARDNPSPSSTRRAVVAAI